MPIPDFGYSGGGSSAAQEGSSQQEEQKTDLDSGKEVKVDANGNTV